MKRIKLIIGSEAEGIAGFLLWQVSRLWQRRLALALKDLTLPVTHAVVLANVLRFSEEGWEITQIGLSKAAKTDRTTASKALQALDRKKLVTRVTLTRDLRAYEVRLTAKGRESAFETIKRLAAAHQAFFTPLKEKENAQMVGLMQRLIQANDFP
jgi:MarR family transcriptional regulator for hemolysin